MHGITCTLSGCCCISIVCVGQCLWADMVCRLHESVHCLTHAGGEVDAHYVRDNDVHVSLHAVVSLSILKHVLNMLLCGIDLLVLILRFDIPPLVCCVRIRMAAGQTAVSASVLYGLISVQLVFPHLYGVCLMSLCSAAGSCFFCKTWALGTVFCALTRLMVLACPRVVLRLRASCGVWRCRWVPVLLHSCDRFQS